MTNYNDQQKLSSIQVDVSSALETAKELLNDDDSDFSYDYRKRLVRDLTQILEDVSGPL